MRKNLLLIALCLTYVAGYVFNGCKKDKPNDMATPPVNGISTSFTEEFDTVSQAISKRGWVTKTAINSYSVLWSQGSLASSDKFGVSYGFDAYSYKNSPTEYAGVGVSDPSSAIDSWLMTPILSVKNGDKISFYTRGQGGNYGDRLQVRLNTLATTNLGGTINPTGDFTSVLIDINSSQASAGYPVEWKKYEYIFSGLAEHTNVRIGFRYYVPIGANGKGIGIDQFKFEVQ